MDPAHESPVLLRLLGAFTVEREGRIMRAEDWPRKKAAALLKRLALERRLLKDQAVESLWPDAGPDSAANNFYKALHVLRHSLDRSLGAGTAEAVVAFEDGVLKLKPEVWVDVEAFERACALGAGADQPEQRAAGLDQALALYRGELLPDDRYEEWTDLPREALRRRHRQARLAAAALRHEAGNYSAAIDLLAPLLVDDRADEQVHYQLMQLHALSGSPQEALRQYRDCADALAADLDAPPAPDTTALYEQILRGELVPAEAARGRGTALRQPGKQLPAAPGADAARPVFVARERELLALEAQLKPAAAGSGGIVFITGEAGAGKTSLLAEFAYRAQVEVPSLAAAAGACQAITGTANPYLPFRAIVAMLTGSWQGPWLRGDVSTLHARRLRSIAPRARQVFADLAPDLSGIITPASAAPQTAPRSLSQRQVFDQMAQALRALAQQQPLLLLLDDLQWVDTASANLLFYLGRQLTNSAVMIAGAYRPSEVLGPASRHPLAQVVQELVRYRGEITIDLDRQTAEEGRSFVDALLDREANRLDVTFREAVFRRTRGHPLFTVELLRVLQEQQALTRDETGSWTAAPDLAWEVLPARVEAAIGRRIERLPEKLRQILKAACIEGESFSLEITAQLLGMEIGRLLHLISHELDQRYRLVQEQGPFRLGSQTVTRYQFRHNLFQQYLYQRLSAAERRYWHAQIAGALEQIGSDGLDELAGTLARHCLAAGDSARAVPYLIRAGDDARRRVALEEAAQFYQAALEHWPERTGESAERAGVLHRLGELLLAMGKLDPAVEQFSAAKQHYERAGDRIGVGAALRLTGRVYWEQANRAKALAYYHQALAALEGEPESVEQALAVAAVAQMHMLGDDYDPAVALGSQALDLAGRLGAEDVRVNALTTTGLALTGKGEVERGLAMVSEALARAEALGLVHEACRAYSGLGDMLVNLERYAEAGALYEKMLAYARKVQAALFEGVALVQLGYLDWWAGRWGAALERRAAVEEWMAASASASMAKIWAATLLGMMYNDLGQPERARAALAPFTGFARSANELQTTVPHLGQLARASTAGERAGLMREILVMIDSVEYGRYDILPALLLACSWLARQTGGDAAALARLERAHAHMPNRQTAAALCEIRGETAGLRGDWQEAQAAYRDAAGHWEALSRPYDLLRVWAGLAWVYESREDEAALQRIRRRAAGLIQQLAAQFTEPDAREGFIHSAAVQKLTGENLV